MSDVLLLAEDVAQEKVVGILTRRLARAAGVDLRVVARRAGGFGRLVDSMKQFRASGVDASAIIVAGDTNCHGLVERRRQIDDAAGTLAERVVHALADPHIERWLLLDGEAFREVVGRGCNAPDQKCEKDRYKRLLSEAVRNAGVRPLFGGIEYAEDLANCINLDRAARADASFRQFVSEWTRTLKTLGGAVRQ